MEQNPLLVSVQVGRAAMLAAIEPGKPGTRSAIVKNPVDGPVWVRTLGLEGDTQVDKRHHGGPYRAVNAYPSEHYNYWRATPELQGMSGGAFGENFTLYGLTETTASIGDVFRVGEVLVAITQPRGPCYKLNRRWCEPTLQDRAIQAGYVGWYFRVLEEGRVEAGQALTLVERPNPLWTIARVWSLYLDPSEKEALRELAGLDGLSPGWRETVMKQIGS